MFNEFNLSDEEILKIINDYNPLIRNASTLNDRIDEDLMQEIKLQIFKILTKNRKKFATSTKKFGLLLVKKRRSDFMEDRKEIKQINEEKDSKIVKAISKTNSEMELITAYTQLVVHTLKHSGTEITPKSIRAEVKMFYEKFGNQEVKRLANIIMKEKKEKK